LSFVVIAVIQLIATGLDLIEFRRSAVANLLTFGALWILLERWRGSEDEFDAIRILWGSVVGLGLTVAGVSFALSGSLATLLQSADVLVGADPLSRDLRWATALLAVGVPFFVIFWWQRMSRRVGTLRDLYVGVVSAIAWFTAAFALSGLLYAALVLLLDLGGNDPVDEIPALATALIVGVLTYWHHRPLLGRERTEPVRAVEYLFGASALVGFASSLVFLTGLVLSTLGSTTLVSDEGRSFVGAIVSLAVTGALTIRYWGRTLTQNEPQSPSRRVALFILFFGSAITGAIALITVLFVLLRSALSGDTSDLFEPLAWGIPTVIVAGLLTWHIVRLRREAAPVAPTREGAPTTSTPTTASPRPVSARMVTLVASDPGPLPQMIEKMRFLRRTDGIGVVDQARADEIMAALAGLEAPAAMVTVDGSGFQVLPIA
jgi:hypothetical protein